MPSAKQVSRSVVALLLISSALGVMRGPAQAQSRCVQVVAWTSPNLLRCQQIGSDHLGRPIWLCC